MQRHAQKLPALNATLRLTMFLEAHEQDFPNDEALEEHFDAARTQLRWDRAALEDDDDDDFVIAPGWRQDLLWASRFNLRPEDTELLDAPAPAAHGGAGAGVSFERTWRTYIRQVLVRGQFLSWTCWPDVIFYVQENKLLAGREERGESEAVARNVVLVFFEALPGNPGAVRRVARDTPGVITKMMTVPELMLTCGATLKANPARTSAQQELELETLFASLELKRWKGILETQAEETYVYTLHQEVNAEEAFLRESAFGSLTKVALARVIERFSGEARRPL
jgi:hypothetical protein